MVKDAERVATRHHPCGFLSLRAIRHADNTHIGSPMASMSVDARGNRWALAAAKWPRRVWIIKYVGYLARV